MHPALSIIAFTTLSGAGYGLAICLGLGVLDPSFVSTRAAHLLALVLIAAGLLSSTLHLGNPQRAWRAVSQWRSSWLSREGVAALLTFVPLLVLGWGAVVDGRHLPVAGLIGVAMSIVTIICTGMIYASLRAVDAWHTPWTLASFMTLSLAGGLALATAFAMNGAGAAPALAGCAALAAMIAWGVKLVWWRRMDRIVPRSTAASATGLGHLGRVRQFEPPHMTDNYLTREMGFVVARRHAAKLRRICLVVGGGAPVLLLVAAMLAGAGITGVLLASAACALLFLGILVERWLFFAEARHSVMAFYGR
jgi:DMSO reductase anchor subunit